MGLLSKNKEKLDSGFVMSLDVAEQKAQEWALHFENFDFDCDEKIKRLVAMGRIDFDEEREIFILKLSKTYDLKDGEKLSVLGFQEPTGHMLKMASKNTDPRTNGVEVSMKLMANSAQIPEGLFERFVKRDFENAALVITFFG